MPATNIQVSKQSVSAFLSSGASHRFVIPDYQRPYSWEREHVQTLFDDLVEFSSRINYASEDGGGLSSDRPSYFLGCVIIHTSVSGEQEIIDGQQRITTLFLLLRAFYAKLEKEEPSVVRDNLLRRIDPALWQINEITGAPLRDRVLLESRVCESDQNEVLSRILTEGVAEEGADDRYSQNYVLCQSLVDEYARRETMQFSNLVLVTLLNTIVLPIVAGSQDDALTIFTTLNERGLLLSDADIFKAKIYSNLSDRAEQEDFIVRWKELNSRAQECGESLQKFFTYNMYYQFARESNRSTSLKRMRAYYLEDVFTRLYVPGLMDDLERILLFWEVVNLRLAIEGESWSQDVDILRMLDILTSYPNDYWKYPALIYYLRYHGLVNFEDFFLRFLRCLTSYLCKRFFVKPGINGVKTTIFTLNIDILGSDEPSFPSEDDFTPAFLEESMRHRQHRDFERMLLKILAYDEPDQVGLLPARWEVEHILPRQWDGQYFPADFSRDLILKKVEYFGNKIPIERAVNRKASNGYFANKRLAYEKSRIAMVRCLSAEGKRDWRIEEIDARQLRMLDRLFEILECWTHGQPSVKE